MLRGGRLSARSLQRLLDGRELAGFVVGCEVEAGGQAARPSAAQQAAVQQLQAALAGMSPALPGGWAGGWSAAGGASCRIMPPAGPAAAAAQERVQPEQQPAQPPGGGGGSLRAAAGGGGERCSLGQLFLQDYLDSLGALNTFG
ncbi:hypothetical protein HT031_003603 [Scenedesmus sp. PABB004]|nr:hypothetical protein HT031_003603 [Scenedesmus sp. PABB004]